MQTSFKRGVEWSKSLFRALISAIYPVYCYGCQFVIADDERLCKNCASHLMLVASCQLKVTATKSVNVYAAYAYSGPMQPLILAKKRSDEYASTVLAQYINEQLPMARFAPDFFVPVPLHADRLAERGFNQATLIAEHLSTLTGIPVIEPLKRHKKTAFQTSLSAEARQANVADAFSWQHDLTRYRDKKICIIDDLYTTGATTKAMARLLFEAKPAEIMIIVAARAL